MNTIIFDNRRIKAYEMLQELGAYCNKDNTFIENLWRGFIADGNLMKEFTYYLDHHSLLDEYHIEGYSLTDIYMWCIGRYNLMQDYGKNGEDCNKEALILDTFSMMVSLLQQPEETKKLLENDLGMDML